MHTCATSDASDGVIVKPGWTRRRGAEQLHGLGLSGRIGRGTERSDEVHLLALDLERLAARREIETDGQRSRITSTKSATPR